MANAARKKETLNMWGAHFPSHSLWKGQFLIRRNGPVISGLCLNETRDKDYYKPTFFIHNLLVPFPVISLSYAAPLLSRGVSKSLKYGLPVDDEARGFLEQVPVSQELLTFKKFFEHVVGAYRGLHGNISVYLPHALRDIIVIGSSLGDADFYSSCIDDVTEVIESKSKTVNMQIIGSVAHWKEMVKSLIWQDHESVIKAEIHAHKLPEMEDLGMDYHRVSDFWTHFK